MEREVPFGRRLRLLRKARELTQAALAQQAYCAIDTIKKLEAGGRRPSRQLAEQLADCLGLGDAERAIFLTSARGGAPGGGSGAAAPDRVANHLPSQPTSFVGRAAELAALGALFADPATRLVTLVGPGGIGKTRLAIALAERLLAAERFPDGVCFVPLAPLDAAERIVPALAEALGFPFEAGQPARPPLRQLIDYLRARQILLVLDNVEHLLGDGEPAGAAQLVAALLDEAPGVAILVTSRELLRLRAEQAYPISGLGTPAAAPLHSDAVALFVQRARQLRPAFAPALGQLEAVARICRLVEGMPLAIELAAGWAGTLTPSAIAAEIERGLDLLATELRDVPARHRSVRAVFDTSYRRLGPPERAIFARLAVFRGGAALAAVREVTRATPAQLQALIGASLLTYETERGRYTLHELLRQYALEKLSAAPEDEAWARDSHTAYYCAFAQRRGAELSGPQQREALAALDAERDNTRAAWAWAARHSRLGLLAQAVDGLGSFYEWRAAFDDGERAYERAAAQLEAQSDDAEAGPILALIRAWQACFRRLQGDMVGARQLLGQSLTLLERAGTAHDTRATRAFALLQLGLVISEGPLAGARQAFEQSLALYRELGRPWEASRALLGLGDLFRYQGSMAEARQHFRASLELRVASGDQRGVAEVLIWDSQAAGVLGQVEEAEALARRGYAIHEQLGDPADRAFGLGQLGVILIWAGKNGQADQALRQSLRCYQDLGDRAMQAYARGWLAAAQLGLGQYAEARELSLQSIEQTRELPGATSGLAFMLHYAGWAALVMGAYTEAEELLQESVALHRRAGNQGPLGWPLAHLSYVHWMLGARARALAETREVIAAAVGQQNYLAALLALPTAALVLAERGRAERAVELYALARRHPLLGNAQSSRDSFGRHLDAVAAALPPDLAAGALARGRKLELWETIAALDMELGSSEPAVADGDNQ